MSTPAWSPASLYQPGALVVPRTAPQTGAVALANGDFENGTAGWSLAGTAVWVAAGGLIGPAAIRSEGSGEANDGSVTSGRYPVTPGQSITLSGMGRVGGGTAGTGFAIALVWYDENDALISSTQSAMLRLQQIGSSWRQVSVVGSAPARARYVRAQGVMNVSESGTTSVIWMDGFSWTYKSPNTFGLMYRATQAAPGLSSSVEPVWPGALGGSVTDGEVTWQAVSISRVVWEARPIMRTGTTEPVWPLVDGGSVLDGTVLWLARTNRVTDPSCPNSPVVAIAASKVFAADGDIVRFSATANPRDWSTTQDAGYLPTGLQQANSNDAAVLAPYRGNLTVFNASSFQMWQVDPDPEAMAILDQMDGVGSSWQHAAQPVANDLFYLSQLGVRTVGIANAAENLASGDVGSPVDELIREEMAAGGRIVATYYPGAGQFWLAFARAGATTVHVYTMARVGQAGAWSRYTFPFSVEAFAQLGDDLYIRHGNSISVVSELASSDQVGGSEINFPGLVWWPWLDFGTPGQTKMMEGFDYVGTGQGPSISIGYDQRNVAAFTPAYQVVNDTMPGGMVPIPVAAPTLSVKLAFAGGQKWNVQSVLLSVLPMQGGP